MRNTIVATRWGVQCGSDRWEDTSTWIHNAIVSDDVAFTATGACFAELRRNALQGKRAGSYVDLGGNPFGVRIRLRGDYAPWSSSSLMGAALPQQSVRNLYGVVRDWRLEIGAVERRLCRPVWGCGTPVPKVAQSAGDRGRGWCTMEL